MRVYLLSPQRYAPEVIAVAFAKASRSPRPLDATAEGLSTPESARFHEKWVIGYGHASVAEHAVLHIAVEGISRLATEVLESGRLASYTEKSTRYQQLSADEAVTPPELNAHPNLLAIYREAVAGLFAVYDRCMETARAEILRRHPPEEGESPHQWEARHRSLYADVCRFLLPAATQANLGITVNARALAHLLRKMLSHPLDEVRQAGEAIRKAAEAETPTLLRRVAPVESWQRSASAMHQRAAAFHGGGTYEEDWCHLVAWEPRAQERVLAALLYQHGDRPYVDYLNHAYGMAADAKQTLAEEALGALAQREVPPRALEYANYLFDLLMDQGAYYEFKRHRMMSQTPQPLTAKLGYTVPRLITEIGLESDYRKALERTQAAYDRLAEWNADVAAYVVPNAFRRRVLAAFNLREAYQFLALRTAPNAHFSMRRIAFRIAEEIQAVHPLLGGFLPVHEGSWQQVEAEHFAQV